MIKIQNNKRGLSTVIETVLIIAISVVAISILASILLPRLDLSPKTACTDLQINLPIEVQDVCYNTLTGDLEVIARRSLNSQEISSLEFSIDNKNFACSNSCGSCQILDSGSSKKYYFAVAQTNLNSLVISANGCAITSTALQNIKNC